MSDYLSQILSRSINSGGAGRIRPRNASLFEPSSFSEGSSLGKVLSQEGFAGVAVEAYETSSSEDGANANARSLSHPGPAGGQLHVAGNNGLSRETFRQSTTESLEEKGSIGGQNASAMGRIELSAKHSGSGGDSGLVREKSNGENIAAEEQGISSLSSSRQFLGQAGALRVAVPAQSSLGNVPERTAVANQGQKHESAPAIKVTIGRIEVRAITPEPRPAPQRTSQKLSLDDYLKERRRGER